MYQGIRKDRVRNCSRRTRQPKSDSRAHAATKAPGTEPAPDRKPSPEHQPISRWGQSGQLAVEPSDELFDDDHHDDDDDQPNDPMEYPVELYEVTERQ